MPSDLVKRLRSPTEHEAWLWSVPYQAADRIEQLEAALREIAGNGNAFGCNPQIMCDIARKALEGKDEQ